MSSVSKSDAIKSTVIGASPEGATDQQSSARAVREMFTSIAPRYDLLNHVLSFNIDRLWWDWQQGHAGQNPTLSGTGAQSPVMDPWSYTESQTHDITALGFEYV